MAWFLLKVNACNRESQWLVKVFYLSLLLSTRHFVKLLTFCCQRGAEASPEKASWQQQLSRLNTYCELQEHKQGGLEIRLSLGTGESKVEMELGMVYLKELAICDVLGVKFL